MKLVTSRARAVGALGSVAALVVVLAACEPSTEPAIIVQARTATVPPRPARPGATSAERFGMGGGPASAGEAGPRRKPLAWETPAGWKEKADPSGMRLAGFALPGDADADCSVTLLPGAAGGVAANVNRWRKQLGLPEVDAAAIEKLPSREILGGPGVVVELEGAYTAGQGPARAGWKLLGLIRQLDVPDMPVVIFVKMVGPAAVVGAEKKAFEALCASLRVAGHGHAEHDGHDHEREGAKPPAAAGTPEPPPPAAELGWKAPQGWTQGPARPMRAVTFQAGAETDCYVTVLPGDAGGIAANLNRWRQQMGQPELANDAIAALPRVELLGEGVPLVEAAGTFADMQGARHEGWLMLGAAAPAGDRTVFVKMIGPEDAVRAERGRFLDFLRSIAWARGQR